MQIRKQQDEISSLDLVEYPVWEFALDEEFRDGQDENTLRPYLTQPPLQIEGTFLIVRANFVLSNGTVLIGFIKPQAKSGSKMMKPVIPYDLNPVVLTDKGPVDFCYGFNKPDEETIAENYRRLGLQAEQVFPISFSSTVEIHDGIATGVLEGFLFFEDMSLNAFNLKDSDIKSTK